MNLINFNPDAIRQFAQVAGTVVGSYLGKAVVVLQANALPIVAAIVIIAAVIIGVKCYKAYVALKEQNKKLENENGTLRSDKQTLINEKTTEGINHSVEISDKDAKIAALKKKLKESEARVEEFRKKLNAKNEPATVNTPQTVPQTTPKEINYNLKDEKTKKQTRTKT